MRPLSELINTAEDAWPMVKAWIDTATNGVEILPVDSAQAATALHETQVTTRSPMGAVVYQTGGLLVDGGWLRILGGGSKKLPRTLPGWNSGRTMDSLGNAHPGYLIADDAAGGFFFLNGGALGEDVGNVYYLSPDNLDFEPLEINYSQFLWFCFQEDLASFYAAVRWKGWQKDAAALPGDSVFSFAPFLFTKEGKDIEKTHRGIVPVDEQYNFTMDMRRQLGVAK